MKGMIIYSFALSEKEPNPCNQKLAEEAKRIAEKEKRNSNGNEIKVAAQWETALGLKNLRIEPDKIICVHRKKGAYLDSEEVTAQAVEYFKKQKITEIIPIAQPFLQITKCRWLIKKAGFVPLKRKINWIGFYKNSLQWYTKGPIRSLIYALMQLFSVYKKTH